MRATSRRRSARRATWTSKHVRRPGSDGGLQVALPGSPIWGESVLESLSLCGVISAWHNPRTHEIKKLKIQGSAYDGSEQYAEAACILLAYISAIQRVYRKRTWTSCIT